MTVCRCFELALCSVARSTEKMPPERKRESEVERGKGPLPPASAKAPMHAPCPQAPRRSEDTERSATVKITGPETQTL
ncbi:hypothetical protein NDU88_002558 [Pleurodeles waltl]|uniref:Uncharacterized protein n=1 Tax=Pleurodeles waltl TaxID=8319 RepID=A0AAV7MN52_PLEWA|nr:hypothetical protein NDU88_002558 [Pleurodeles waltl]